MDKQIQRNGHLVLVPCPYQGHITPMLQLAKALHSKGFSITITHTVYNAPNPKNHPDFSFIPLPEGLPDHDMASMDLVADVQTINENCQEIFRTALERAIEEGEARGEVTRCVILDEIMFFAKHVASDLKLPSVILRTTSAATSFARTGLVKLNQLGRLVPQGSPNELVPELHPLRYKDLPFTLSTTKFDSFSNIIAKIYDHRTSSAMIWNTEECLEQLNQEQIQQQCQVPIFPIGPIHMISPLVSSTSLIKEDKTCISWLDKQPDKSVIYVSIGSLGSLSQKEVCEIAWGLANSGQRFLWVIRPGSIRGSDWIELLPEGFQNVVGEKGCVVKWAPQKDVLAHGAVSGFWSHCGWNSTLESLAEGVPMICKPCFGDQRVNARYVSHVWRVGLELEELERGEIERAIRRMILGDEGNVMRARAKEFKEKFEISIKKGGSSYASLNKLVNFLVSN